MVVCANYRFIFAGCFTQASMLENRFFTISRCVTCPLNENRLCCQRIIDSFLWSQRSSEYVGKAVVAIDKLISNFSGIFD